MISIKTERLVLRNFVASDSMALHAMIVQYESSEYAAYDHQWPTSSEEITGITEWFARGDHFLAVCLKETEQFIRFVALNPEPGDVGAEFNIGYIFNADHHGKGYATEACRAVLGHAFGRLQARRVVTGTAAVNRASCRLLERLGFQKTAAGTGSFKTAADGRPIEFLGYTYAISRDAWQKTGTLE